MKDKYLCGTIKNRNFDTANENALLLTHTF